MEAARQRHKVSKDKLWPEEEKAIEDIMIGKTKTVKQCGEDFLKDLEGIINET